MIKLERHIEILLLSNDCVIVPELGGFMAHQVYASYNEEDSTFLPPLRTLGFNPQLKLNDSLLAQSYVEAYDISYPEALRRIADEVRELKQSLDNEGSYILHNIGKLYTNSEGNLSFEPCEAGILTPNLYGLSSFEFTQLQDEKTIVQQKTSVNGDVVNQALKNIVVDDKSIFLNNEEGGEDERTIKIKVSWLRNAVIAAAAIVMLIVIVTPLSDLNKTGFTMSNLSNELFTSMMPKDTSKGDLKAEIVKDSSTMTTKVISSSKVSDCIADTSSFLASNPKPNKDSLIEENYCIILASRITRKNADLFVEELKNAGIKDVYTYVHNDVVRVAYGKFTSEVDAQDSLRKLRDNHYFEQAWVYKK